MKAWLGFAVAALLAGCASGPFFRPDDVFADARFAPPSQPVDNAAIFALSDDMRAFAAQRIDPLAAREGSMMRALFQAVKGELTLDYDATRTRVAADTFSARSGNCLSLVILTAAFARELNVPIVYRSVYGHDTWSRSDGVLFQAGHMDIELGSAPPNDPIRNMLVIDFLAPDTASKLHVRPESEKTVIGMYWNNRAAETMLEGRLDDAYWYARAAIGSAPYFLSAYNTLGVIYLRHGDLAQAERALRFVLERQPDDVSALLNLIAVEGRQGHERQVADLRDHLAKVQPYPPFYFLDQGLAAIKAGQYDQALELLEQERKRMPYDEEVQFAIAVAEFHKGDLDGARQHLSLAVENSTTRDRRDIYAAKMAALQRLQTQN